MHEPGLLNWGSMRNFRTYQRGIGEGGWGVLVPGGRA